MGDLLLPQNKVERVYEILRNYHIFIQWEYDENNCPIYKSGSYIYIEKLLPELESILMHESISEFLPSESEEELRDQVLKNNDLYSRIQLKILENYKIGQQILLKNLEDKIKTYFGSSISEFQTVVRG